MKERLAKIHLVVSDIDGTLLTADNTLHPGSFEALTVLKSSNACDFTLCTGRSFRLTEPLMDFLGLHTPFIFSGGAIYDPSSNQVMTDHFIDETTIEAVSHFAQERALGLIAHTSRCMLCLLNDSDWRSVVEIEWIRGKSTDHAVRVDSIRVKKNDPIIRFDIFSEDQPLSAAYLQVCQCHCPQPPRRFYPTHPAFLWIQSHVLPVYCI